MTLADYLATTVACGALLVMTFAASGAAARQPATAAARRPLRDVVAFYGFPTVTSTETSFTCRSAYTTLGFESGSRRMLVNGVPVFLNGAVGGPRDRWQIDAVDADSVLDAVLRPRRVMPNRRVRIVMLDPGHGGADTGAVGARNVQEKRVTLDIARRVRAKLHAEPFVVRLTREADESVSLAERVQRANAARADLFVSIHINAAPDRNVSGIETFVLPAAGYPSTSQSQAGADALQRLAGNQFDAANTLLGYSIHKALVEAVQAPDRGLKRARFAVLKNIECPAVLVECGFVSNPREEERILLPEYRDRLADGIARGIRAFAERNR